MFAKLFQWVKHTRFFQKKLTKQKLKPVIIPRKAHTLTRRLISPQALKVLYRLHDAGFQAYLVGGGVRDVLLGKHPKDFDVATNAHPEQVAALFRNSRMIGRRFRLVHVHFGGHIVEVATFRAGHEDLDPAQQSNILKHAEDGMILRDNIYGTLEQDVWRRDFTINALYYNIADFSLLDYVGGLSDLKAKVIRLIGDPVQRYREDPIRMLRALRFAAKLDFTLHKHTKAPITEMATLIANVPSARVFDEYLKLFLNGFAFKSFLQLEKFGLFQMLFPATHRVLKNNHSAFIRNFIELSLKNTDGRVLEDKPVSPMFLLAVFLWYPILELKEHLKASHPISPFQAFHEACDEVLSESQKAFAMPRRMIQFVKEIWLLQMRMQTRHRSKVRQVETHPRFRAAFDFLILRKKALEPLGAYADWWIQYHDANETTRMKMLSELGEKKRKRHKRVRKKTSSDSSNIV